MINKNFCIRAFKNYLADCGLDACYGTSFC